MKVAPGQVHRMDAAPGYDRKKILPLPSAPERVRREIQGERLINLGLGHRSCRAGTPNSLDYPARMISSAFTPRRTTNFGVWSSGIPSSSKAVFPASKANRTERPN